MASIAKRPDGQWQARYRVTPGGRQYSTTTRRKVDAQRWLDERTTAVQTGNACRPEDREDDRRAVVFDVARRVRDAAGVDRAAGAGAVARIVEAFGDMPLSAVRPSHVKAWTARLTGDGHEPSYVYALHARLAQILADAVHDGIIAALAMLEADLAGAGQAAAVRGDHGAGVGVARRDARPLPGRGAARRVRRAAGRGGVRPAGRRRGLHAGDHHAGRPVPGRTVEDRDGQDRGSDPAEPDARRSRLTSSAGPAETVLRSERGRQLRGRGRSSGRSGPRGRRWTVWRTASGIHDLRHYFASLLIASGADVKTVQGRLRHASAKTTLDTYGHMWPDRDESTRAAVEAALVAREESLRNARASP